MTFKEIKSYRWLRNNTFHWR